MADQSRDELACVYAALVLLDDDVAITVNIFFYTVNFPCTLWTCQDGWGDWAVLYWSSAHVGNLNFIKLQAEKIQTILKAADVKVEPYWPGLFAKALDGLNLKSMITNVGSGVGAAPAAGAAAAGNICLISCCQ